MKSYHTDAPSANGAKPHHQSRLYGRAQETAQALLEAFRAGRVAAPLANVFLQFDDSPCRRWSYLNRLAVALAGYDDARGFRQWQDVGRHVKKGQHGFPILVPILKNRTETDKETGEERTCKSLVGFGSTIVFGYEQTDGAELPRKAEAKAYVDTLPLVNVARSWGLTVVPADTRNQGAAGWYSPTRQAIAVGVRNYATWAHELVHAADDRLGHLERKGQFWASEIVAELGGCILLRILGHEVESDTGGCLSYLVKYATDAEIDTHAACLRVLDRTCKAVALILEAVENETSETESQAA